MCLYGRRTLPAQERASSKKRKKRGYTGMTDDQRELLLKASDSLSAAKYLLYGGYTDFAASRAYYAMFYVAEAF